MAKLIGKILIANRGEIACRIAATCRRLGIASVGVFSEADRDALHVRMCDEALPIGAAEAARSYLSTETILAAARASGADAIHPGYGFLSESPAFARACGEAGLIFIGPAPETIATMGSKVAARRLAASLGMTCIPGYEGDDQADVALADAAGQVGYPLMIKASAGGGGKGIRIVRGAGDLAGALDLVRREATAAFGSSDVLLERLVGEGRHIEVQVVGDHHGKVLHLHDRDCSLQRRHQKIIEEAPAPGLPAAVRQAMLDMAVTLAESIGYRSLGTVEFLYDSAQDQLFFLEMNTRIQVEHPVTEMVTGLDLVELQIRIAEGRPLPFGQDDIKVAGHAIEARLNAEEPEHGFRPSIGRITLFSPPQAAPAGVVMRLDSGVDVGSQVTPYYDSMLAKLIVAAPDRDTARQAMIAALDAFDIGGIATNSAYLAAVLGSEDYQAATVTTSFLDTFRPWEAPLAPRQIENMLAAAVVDRLMSTEAALAQNLGDTPWGSLGAWRLLSPSGHAARSIVDLEDSLGQHYAMTVSGRKGTYLVEWDGACFIVSAERTAEGLLVRRDEGVFVARVRADGDRILVQIGSDRRTFRLLASPEGQAAHAHRGTGGRDIVAPLPGLVVEVLAQAGHEVEAGQPIVMLEAMKMIHSLTAAEAGIVEEVTCAIGEAVEMGRTLVRFAHPAVAE